MTRGRKTKRFEGFPTRHLLTDRRLRTAVRLLLRGDWQEVWRRVRRLRGGGPDVPGAPPRVTVDRNVEPLDPVVPLVCVVIPSFNHGALLPEALASVEAQTWQDLEIIVVEGGSTDDDSANVARQLTASRQSDRVRLVTQTEPRPPGDNRNAGIAATQARYICCLDADDRLAPTYVEVALFLCERYGYDVASSAMRCFGATDEIIRTLEYPTLEDLLRGNWINIPAVFRREDWQKSGGFVDTGRGAELIHEDWRFWVRLAALGARMVNVLEPLFLYRRNEPGMSLSTHPDLPPLDVQRRAIQGLNADVIDKDAIRRSAELAAVDVEVKDGLLNLTDPARWSGARKAPRILVALPWLMVGGVDRYLATVLADLVDQGFGVVVVTTLRPPASAVSTRAWFERFTSEVFELPRLLHDSRWEAFLDHLIASRDIKLLWQVGSEWMYGQLPRLKTEFPDLRAVDQLFNTTGHTGNNRRYANHIDLTVVENDAVEGWLTRHGASPDSIAKIPGGIDLGRYRPSSNRSDPASLQVLFLGRWSEEKGPLEFISLAARCRDLDDVDFVLAGGGPLRAAVAATARRHPDVRLRLVEDPDDDRALSLLRAADLLVVPSLIDGRPQVIMEAMACGTPVLATDVGGISDLVAEHTGVLVPAHDLDALERTLRQLHHDRHVLVEMGIRAREVARESFDVAVTVERFRQLWQLMAESGIRRG